MDHQEPAQGQSACRTERTGRKAADEPHRTEADEEEEPILRSDRADRNQRNDGPEQKEASQGAPAQDLNEEPGKSDDQDQRRETQP